MRTRVQVSCGRAHCCAIRWPDGQVVCWGDKSLGRLGPVPPAPPSARAPAPDAPAGFRSVCAGAQHSCALDDIGLRCWGREARVPPRLARHANLARVACAGGHTCVVSYAGQAHCFGDGVPQLQNTGVAGVAPSLSAPSCYPSATAGWEASAWNVSRRCVKNGAVELAPAASFLSVSVGWNFACGVTCTSGGGRVTCWGSESSQTEAQDEGRHRLRPPASLLLCASPWE